MTHIPPIAREARDWLLENSTSPEMNGRIRRMPLAPSSDLDAVRARFQPKTRGGYEYEIFAERNGLLYGMYTDSCGYGRATAWGLSGENPKAPAAELLPLSPHAALIAEGRAYIRHGEGCGASEGKSIKLVRALVDALEARDKP